jgi:alkanesulfonate monooxygenase SsuD/methylene tetrahydromethanopterin reductase-like flavin-dependent oxidoreductase (luciferase family)
MKLSIVDMSPVLAGSTAVEALRTTVQLAQLADHAGFSRYRVGELHGSPTHAGTPGRSSRRLRVAEISAGHFPASSMTLTTSFGCDRNGTWLDLISVVFAFMRFA